MSFAAFTGKIRAFSWAAMAFGALLPSLVFGQAVVPSSNPEEQHCYDRLELPRGNAQTNCQHLKNSERFKRSGIRVTNVEIAPNSSYCEVAFNSIVTRINRFNVLRDEHCSTLKNALARLASEQAAGKRHSHAEIEQLLDSTKAAEEALREWVRDQLEGTRSNFTVKNLAQDFDDMTRAYTPPTEPGVNMPTVMTARFGEARFLRDSSQTLERSLSNISGRASSRVTMLQNYQTQVRGNDRDMSSITGDTERRDEKKGSTLDDTMKMMQLANMGAQANNAAKSGVGNTGSMTPAAMPALPDMSNKAASLGGDSAKDIAAPGLPGGKSQKKGEGDTLARGNGLVSESGFGKSNSGAKPFQYSQFAPGSAKTTAVADTGGRNGSGSSGLAALNARSRSPGSNGGKGGDTDGELAALGAGGLPGFNGAGGDKAEEAAAKNFIGGLGKQEDSLDGQSEIAKILGEMQSMFSSDGASKFGSFGSSSASAATGGLSRDDEISRFEKFERGLAGTEQGSRLLASGETLVEFSLFSRVHRRHTKSMEKGLVIFGLRHRVE